MNFQASLSYNKQVDHTEIRPSIANNVIINGGGGKGSDNAEPTVSVSSSASLDRELVKPRVPLIRINKPTSTETDPSPTPALTEQDPLPITRTDDEPASQIVEHKLLQVLVGLFSQDITLIKNVIEPSEGIILTKTDLVDLIQTITGEQNVEIISEPPHVKCFEKLKMWDIITRIKVNNLDFHVEYNHQYNQLQQYHISLTKIINL